MKRSKSRRSLLQIAERLGEVQPCQRHSRRHSRKLSKRSGSRKATRRSVRLSKKQRRSLRNRLSVGDYKKMSEFQKNEYHLKQAELKKAELIRKGAEMKLRLNKAIENVEKSFKDRIGAIEQKLNDLKKTYNQYKSEIEKGRSQIQSKKDLVMKLKDQINILVVEIQNLPNEIKQKEAFIEALQKQNIPIAKELEKVKKERDVAIERVRKGQY